MTPFWSSGGRWEREESQAKRKEAGGGNLPAGCVQSEDGTQEYLLRATVAIGETAVRSLEGLLSG